MMSDLGAERATRWEHTFGDMAAGTASVPDAVSFGGARGRVQDGKWIHNSPEWEGHASYLQVDLGRPVRSLGLEAEFTGDGGSIALVLPTDDWSATDYHGWKAAVHFVASRRTWKATYYDAPNGKPIYARGVFWRKLPLGTPHRFALDIDGMSLTIHLPNGRTYTARHPKIAEAGTRAIHELFTLDGGRAPASLVRIWAA